MNNRFNMMAKPIYLRHNVILMTLISLYKIKTDNVIKKKLYGLWKLTIFLTMLFLTVSNIIDLWIKRFESFDQVIKNYIYLGGGSCVWLKIIYWFINTEACSEIVKEINDIFKYKTDTGLVEKDIREYLKFSEKVTFAWAVYISLAGQIFVLLPLVIYSERTLSLPLWLPFDWKVSPFYEITLFLQMLIQQVITTTVVATDMLFASGLILTCGQFKLLGWEFKHVVYKTLLQNNVELDIVLAFKSQYSDINLSPHRSPSDLNEAQLIFIRNIMNSSQFKSDLLQNLNDLIEFHESMVKFCKRLDVLFSPSYLLHFVSMIMTIVFIEYNLIAVLDTEIIILSCLYLLAALVTVLIPCYFSNLMTSQVEQFLYDLYDTPWFICDKNFQVNFKMVHLSACRPIYFTIGKFGYLTLSTYLAIIRVSISYVAVLREITADS